MRALPPSDHRGKIYRSPFVWKIGPVCRRAGLAIGALILLTAAGCGGSKGTRGESRAPRSSFPTIGCRNDPLMGVHSPDRLKLLGRCRAVVGIVREPETNSADGDEAFKVSPDPAYASMLNEKNVKKGGIHAEIVPADQAGCVKGQQVEHPGLTGLGKCTGAHLKLPRAGARVQIVGAYVFDTNNNWREIHPVWKISTVP